MCSNIIILRNLSNILHNISEVLELCIFVYLNYQINEIDSESTLTLLIIGSIVWNYVERVNIL